MKLIECQISEIPDGEFSDSLRSTVDHTLQAVAAAYAFFHDPKFFQAKYSIDISNIERDISDFHSLAMLMFIHDFYKLTEKNSHATRAADFLSTPQHIDLIRYHDVLGIIHTGEASLLFLEPLVVSTRALPEDQRIRFLNNLLIITVIDVASLGFLNQLRVDTYRDVIDKLNKVMEGKNLADIAREDTPQRIQRLICSNNRFLVEPDVVNDRIYTYSDCADLLEQLLYVRFDAGVYVLEPLLRYMLRKPYEMSSKECVKIQKTDHKVLDKWIKAVHNLLRKERKEQAKLEILDLNNRSIKGNANLDTFKNWAQQNIK